MKKIGIYYASISGSTAKVSQLIAESLNVDEAHVHNLMDVSLNNTIRDYELVIFGSPTYGKGELHYLWQEEFLETHDELLKGKPYALFALGDKKYHTKTFAGALEKLKESIEMYEGVNFGKMLKGSNSGVETSAIYGLILDEVNEPFLTKQRIRSWSQHLKNNLKSLGYHSECPALTVVSKNYSCKKKCKRCIIAS